MKSNLNNDIFIATPEEISRFAKEGSALHISKPTGWSVSEIVGQSIVNPRAVSRIAMFSPPVRLPSWVIPGVLDVALLSELIDDCVRVFLGNDDETEVGKFTLGADIIFTPSSTQIPFVGVGPCAHSLMEEISTSGAYSRLDESVLYEDFVRDSMRSIIVGKVMIP
jgi:hypothetical protein